MSDDVARPPAVLAARATHRWSAVNVRGALWAYLALRQARRDLASIGLRTIVRPPPSLPPEATRGVRAVLRRSDPSCLERSMVLQCWLSAQGARHDLVVGVGRSEGGKVVAHAWLDFEQPVSDGVVFEELTRRQPSGRSPEESR